MTDNCGKLLEGGDRGQRYEITYFDPDADGRCIFGWSDTPKGAATMEVAIDLHPSWSHPQTQDRDARQQEQK